MILSKKLTTENSKNGNLPAKVSLRNPSSNGSTNKNFTAISRRSSATRSRAATDAYAESYNIKEVTNTDDPQKRLAKLLGLVDQLGPGDFEQVLADFRELGLTQDRMHEYGLLLDAWAKINPEDTLAYAKEKTEFSFASSTILTTWARYAAIQWAKLNHKGKIANPHLVGIIKGITSTNTSRTTDLILELPSSVERGQAPRAILPHINKLGTKKAIAWLDTIKDEKTPC